jgi:uncharacterized integral membrane protein
MIAIFRWILTVICLATLLTWCFLNRGDVPFDWSPAHDPIAMPLFGVIMLSAMMGFIWGALVVWLNAAPERRAHRQLKRDANDMAQKIAAFEQADVARNPDAVIAGLLPVKRGWWSRS